MKAFYDQQPLKLEKDNNGSAVFRWNIEEVTTDEEITQWKCDEVRFFGLVDRNTIKKAIIREHLTETEEFSIINKFNAHNLGIAIDETAVTKYTDYLNYTFSIDAILETL